MNSFHNNTYGVDKKLLPIEMLFFSVAESQFDADKNIKSIRDSAKPIAKSPLVRLYRGFLNGKEIGENDKDNIVLEYERFQLIQGKVINTGIKVLDEQVPKGILDDERNVFYILNEDEIRWTVILYLRGYRRIPVRITIEDYNRAFDEKKEIAVREIFNNRANETLREVPRHMSSEGRYDITNVYTPILHPSYYDVIVSRDYAFPSRMDLINEFFSNEKFCGKTIIDIGSNLSYISHNFARQGAKCTCLEYVEQRARFANALTHLYGLDNLVEVVNNSFFDFETSEKFNIGIILSIFYHWSTKIGNEGSEFLLKLDNLVEDMLIWESGDKAEDEKKLIIEQTKFKKYIYIGNTIGTGKYRELGVFVKE